MPVVRQRPFFIGIALFVVSLWALLYLFSTAMAANKEINGFAQVLSANLILIKGKTVRLFGIYAPQLDQICKINGAKMRCGVVAWAELIRIADGAYLSCDVEKTKDRKTGIKVATCYSGEHDIGEALVRTGYAGALISQTDRYRVDQEEAKQADRGLWVGEYFSDLDDAAFPSAREVNKKIKGKKADGLNEKPQSAILRKTPSTVAAYRKNNRVDIARKKLGQNIIKDEDKKKGSKQKAARQKGTSEKSRSNASKMNKVREKKNSKSQPLVAEKNTALQETSEINAVKEDLADNAGLSGEDVPMSHAESFFQRIFGDDNDKSDAGPEF